MLIVGSGAPIKIASMTVKGSKSVGVVSLTGVKKFFSNLLFSGVLWGQIVQSEAAVWALFSR